MIVITGEPRSETSFRITDAFNVRIVDDGDLRIIISQK
jgi:hypothetical protein